MNNQKSKELKAVNLFASHPIAQGQGQPKSEGADHKAEGKLGTRINKVDAHLRSQSIELTNSQLAELETVIEGAEKKAEKAVLLPNMRKPAIVGSMLFACAVSAVSAIALKSFGYHEEATKAAWVSGGALVLGFSANLV